MHWGESKKNAARVLVERVRLDGRGRVPIPSPIRRQLELNEGENLVWVVEPEGDLLLLLREKEAAALLLTRLDKKRHLNLQLE